MELSEGVVSHLVKRDEGSGIQGYRVRVRDFEVRFRGGVGSDLVCHPTSWPCSRTRTRSSSSQHRFCGIAVLCHHIFRNAARLHRSLVSAQDKAEQTVTPQEKTARHRTRRLLYRIRQPRHRIGQSRHRIRRSRHDLQRRNSTGTRLLLLLPPLQPPSQHLNLVLALPQPSTNIALL